MMCLIWFIDQCITQIPKMPLCSGSLCLKLADPAFQAAKVNVFLCVHTGVRRWCCHMRYSYKKHIWNIRGPVSCSTHNGNVKNTDKGIQGWSHRWDTHGQMSGLTWWSTDSQITLWPVYLLPKVLVFCRRLLCALWWGIRVQEVWVL